MAEPGIFTATLTFLDGEIIPITTYEAVITGATSVTVEFDFDGNVLNVTGDLSETQIAAIITRLDDYSYEYGYYYFGYGYGYCGHGVSNVIRYQVCISTAYMNLGDHNI